MALKAGRLVSICCQVPPVCENVPLTATEPLPPTVPPSKVRLAMLVEPFRARVPELNLRLPAPEIAPDQVCEADDE